MYIRLEYSETTGHFHFSPLNEKGENKNGYLTLSSKIRSHQAEHFCEHIKIKFSTLETTNETVSFAKMKQEFLDFISSEIKSMREAMAALSGRRSQIFKNY